MTTQLAIIDIDNLEKSINTNQGALEELINLHSKKVFLFYPPKLYFALANIIYSCKNRKVKDLLLGFLASNSQLSLGEFVDSCKSSIQGIKGLLKRDDIEKYFMKILEELADLHEEFRLEAEGLKPPELTEKLLQLIDTEGLDTITMAGQFREMVKILFNSLRRAHEYKLDLVLI